HLHGMQGVNGSIPFISTIGKPRKARFDESQNELLLFLLARTTPPIVVFGFYDWGNFCGFNGSGFLNCPEVRI
ncbi:MAG: hypothetical protein RSC08_03145, partial [Oscillospiraceae bacterium]